MVFAGVDLLTAAVMFLIGFAFFRSKGKGADFLSGYNMRSDEERKKFDEAAMCICYGKRMMAMAIPFVAGAALDLVKRGLGMTLSWIVWFILFVLLIRKRTQMEK